MRKNYILDTNILISSPNAIFGFKDNNVYITTTTLQELDKLKTAHAEIGWGAREAIRNIEKCRCKGKLKKGVDIGHGGLLYTVDSIEDICCVLPVCW